ATVLLASVAAPASVTTVPEIPGQVMLTLPIPPVGALTSTREPEVSFQKRAVPDVPEKPNSYVVGAI
ncbi:MAG: hypothetical protein JWO28_3343, partial [Hyphomicrobiales bacterium]|nr:hypothetical protein [Hyphomicrobiales bacterium]